MTELQGPQVGDTVRMQIEGTVREISLHYGDILSLNLPKGDFVYVNSRYYTVDIIKRAAPKLPTEPGTQIKGAGGAIFTLARNGWWYCGNNSVNDIAMTSILSEPDSKILDH